MATAGDVVQMVGAIVAFEALGHEEILGGDAVCVCDGQTPAHPSQRARRVGHPRLFIDILGTHRWATRLNGFTLLSESAAAMAVPPHNNGLFLDEHHNSTHRKSRENYSGYEVQGSLQGTF